MKNIGVMLPISQKIRLDLMGQICKKVRGTDN